MKHTYVEHRPSLGMVSEMLRLQYKSDLKEELCKHIKAVRWHIQATRQGYPDMDSWDCGRQDAYGEKIEQLFRHFEVLKGAYQLSKGRSTVLVKHFKRAVGE